MDVTLPLDKMSVADKLATMEILWDDLSRQAGELAVPGWHYEILADREAAVRESTEAFIDWSAAKVQLRSPDK